MSLIMKNYPEEDCILGIWSINEDIDALASLVSLEKEEFEILDGFKNNQRKIEWLSVRALTKELTGQESRIIYNGNRKPYLYDWSYNISISHSGKLTSVMLSRKRKIGIDLELMSHEIDNLAHKFINQEEFITTEPDLATYHLYIHWCAKEALYKICDKQDINFKHNLTIAPFSPREEGIIEGRVTNKYGMELIKMHYFRLQGHVVVWCVK
jgi:4'-phosphopantetheinyl transferase